MSKGLLILDRAAYEKWRESQLKPESHLTVDEAEEAVIKHGLTFKRILGAATAVNAQEELTLDQWEAVLMRLHDYVANGGQKVLDDSDVVGNKHTHCSWGRCTNSKEIWSDPSTHTWPFQFLERGRVAPIETPEACFCPMDRGNTTDPDHTHPKDNAVFGPNSGCFYRCRLFSPKKNAPKVTRAYALKLIDRRLAEVRKMKAGAM